jgi:galactose-6-phosphate isomerase
MYLSKVHKLVVATITDVYSAYMTPLHNNTKVIIIPTSIVAEDLANKLAKYFIDAEFEGGRHMVRIDMLDKETE